MRIFARFDEVGTCVGCVVSSDPTAARKFINNPAYEEITDPTEQELVQHEKCKRIIDENGTRRIVLIETVE